MQEDVPQESAPEQPIEPVAAPQSGAPAVEMLTNATCWLQPNPRYGDGEPLVEIPQSSVVSLGSDVQADDHGRPWQQVTYEGHTGYVQVQNLRDA